MKFTKDANSNGTSLQGSIVTTYAELVQVFGQPDYGPDADMDKTTCEWALQFEDGTIATIYDWKTRGTPYGQYDWHIGGSSGFFGGDAGAGQRAVEYVTEAIMLNREKLYRMVKDHA
jgi:hypothetical protein